MVLCYKITHKYKELLPFLLYLMIASIYYENANYFKECPVVIWVVSENVYKLGGVIFI